jgi:ketosteroid isomerase-like protein
MRDLRKLTEEYVMHFNQKDLIALGKMFSEDISLTDPDVSVQGKTAVLKAIDSIFENFEKLDFRAQNICVDGRTSIIEFSLQLNEMYFVGTDIIEWDGSNLKSLRAYLYEKK